MNGEGGSSVKTTLSDGSHDISAREALHTTQTREHTMSTNTTVGVEWGGR